MRTYVENQLRERRQKEAMLERDLRTLQTEIGVFEEMLRHLDAESLEAAGESPQASPVAAQASMPAVRKIAPIKAPTATSFKLSPHWAKILRILSESEKSFDAGDILAAAELVGAQLRMTNVRSQIAYYKKRKVFRKVQVGRYALTDAGRDFLKKSEDSGASTPESSFNHVGEAGSPEDPEKVAPTSSSLVSSISTRHFPSGKSVSGQPPVPFVGRKGG